MRATVNEVLVQELHKPVIKKFKRKEVCSWFKYSVMAADTAEMGLLSSKNFGVKYFRLALDNFIKYYWVKLLKDEKAKTVFNGFIGIVNKSKRKQNNLWVV